MDRDKGAELQGNESQDRLSLYEVISDDSKYLGLAIDDTDVCLTLITELDGPTDEITLSIQEAKSLCNALIGVLYGG